MRNRKIAGTGAAILLLTLVMTGAMAQSPATEEDHKASILGIELGMTPQAVVERVGGRGPDGRRDDKDVVQLFWRLEDGSMLQVNFRKERVIHLAVQYKNPRPTTDLWLQPLSNPASRSGLTAADPRFRRDYKATETRDKERTVWVRQEKSPAGYRVDVQFWSGTRKQYGDRFEEYVEFKYVSVAKEDMKKFEQATAQKP